MFLLSYVTANIKTVIP